MCEAITSISSNVNNHLAQVESNLLIQKEFVDRRKGSKPLLDQEDW